MTIEAPAKINLHLAVKGKRPDGFHDLESVFLAVDFADTLHFEPIQGVNSLDLTMKDVTPACPCPPVEKNIIFRALSLFRGKTGFDRGLRIMVEKRIPIGGGLGGGSSDAASTLLALNKLADSPLSAGELLEMAAALGSDVPFFVHETSAAHVTGRGENIEPLKEPPFHHCFFVLVNPGFPSDTAAAFRLLDEYREKGDSHLFEPPPDWPFYNDFLPIFKDPEKSVYDKIISRLLEQGAEFASLSGAGSTCFGVFKEQTAAERATTALRDEWSFVEVCEAKNN